MDALGMHILDPAVSASLKRTDRMSSETSHPTGLDEARVIPRKNADDLSLENSREDVGERVDKTSSPVVNQQQRSKDVKVGAALPERDVDAMAESTPFEQERRSSKGCQQHWATRGSFGCDR
jgi:hypothetical protein